MPVKPVTYKPKPGDNAGQAKPGGWANLEGPPILGSGAKPIGPNPPNATDTGAGFQKPPVAAAGAADFKPKPPIPTPPGLSPQHGGYVKPPPKAPKPKPPTPPSLPPNVTYKPPSITLKPGKPPQFKPPSITIKPPKKDAGNRNANQAQGNQRAQAPPMRGERVDARIRAKEDRNKKAIMPGSQITKKYVRHG